MRVSPFALRSSKHEHEADVIVRSMTMKAGALMGLSKQKVARGSVMIGESVLAKVLLKFNLAATRRLPR